MTTHYRKRYAREAPGLPLSRRLAFLSAAFFVGYFCASFIDFQQLSAWLNTHSPFDSHSTEKAPLARKSALAPKPKLEFYTLLTSNHGTPLVSSSAPAQLSVSTPAKVANVKPITAAVNDARNINTTQPPVMMAKPVFAKATAPTVNKPAPSVIKVSKLAYTLQVAAFRTRQDAEHMKASLLLKGFDTSVIAIESQHVPWFRVMVGPFASREQAQKIQTLLARRERMNGMIRKMDA